MDYHLRTNFKDKKVLIGIKLVLIVQSRSSLLQTTNVASGYDVSGYDMDIFSLFSTFLSFYIFVLDVMKLMYREGVVEVSHPMIICVRNHTFGVPSQELSPS